MAAELGLDAIRADALATIGTARHDLGDRSGDADLELAIELAEAANAPLALSRALNNLAWRLRLLRPPAGARDLDGRTYEAMRRYGHVSQIWWARGQLADTALSSSDAGTKRSSTSRPLSPTSRPAHRSTPKAACRVVARGHRLARGDDQTSEQRHRSERSHSRRRRPIPRIRRRASRSSPSYRRACRATRSARARRWSRPSRSSRQRESAGSSSPTKVRSSRRFSSSTPQSSGSRRSRPRTHRKRRADGCAATTATFSAPPTALEELGFVSDEMYLRLQAGRAATRRGATDEGRAQIERALDVLPRRARDAVHRRSAKRSSPAPSAPQSGVASGRARARGQPGR